MLFILPIFLGPMWNDVFIFVIEMLNLFCQSLHFVGVYTKSKLQDGFFLVKSYIL